MTTTSYDAIVIGSGQAGPFLEHLIIAGGSYIGLESPRCTGVLVDAESERILGASMLCIEGDEIVHLLLDVMAANASYKVIEHAVHIHPTVSELIPTLLGSLKPLGPPV